jgi:hypothetical protein
LLFAICHLPFSRVGDTNMVSNTGVTDYVEGSVGRSHDRGFTLSGRDGWLNISRYAEPPPPVPAEGSRVRVGLDKGGFVRSVEVLEAPAPLVREPGVAYGLDRDTRIMRQAVLNTATAILSSGGQVTNAADVVALAEELEAWVNR